MSNTKASNPATFLRQLDHSITVAQKELDKQERFVKGLQLARESVSGAILTDAVKPHHHNGHNVNGASRVQRIKTILAAAPGPVSVDDIMAEMAKHGQSDEKRLVYSTISYLKRIGSVKSTGRGQWTAVTEQVAA